MSEISVPTIGSLWEFNYKLYSYTYSYIALVVSYEHEKESDTTFYICLTNASFSRIMRKTILYFKFGNKIAE